MRHASTLTCIVPGLNEAENIPLLLPVLVQELRKLKLAFEIIIVDDGSTDNTETVTKQLLQHYPELVYIQLSRNFGKEAALTAGLQASQGDVVVCLDADMQHPPSLIPEMLHMWQGGLDMVYAVRASRDDEGWGKRIGTALFYKLMRTSNGLRVPRDAGDFRLLDRNVVQALLALPERSRFMKGLFAWVGFQSGPIYYTPAERAHGVSRFKPGKLLRFAVDGLTAFTTWPLRLVSLLGTLLALLSFSYGLFVLLKYFVYGEQVRGWVSLITVVLFFSGVNLMSLGIVGEYIASIFVEVKDRPLYLVRQRTGKGLPDSQSPKSE
ncbi:glycosyltransferase family 2 protein [Alcaligenes endophyticus]|uniref:Glycosyltransferase family 2 protein n=1 Tax=Alcaligenes endophyticus TaxID=1929088 RepID=A0ABT8EGS2_9BURK|nr:glycosyltransferase family 2 protein [Alcaligenes endophyticus]MCX5589848.1 glycosyltransferase family 2 protein [Alcaligenes endophyticus]MDN4120489.1 glycosyltransferase family 2 protein [Alcaligenes endophyticus]